MTVFKFDSQESIFFLSNLQFLDVKKMRSDENEKCSIYKENKSIPGLID